jgi:TetR/AcrR family transcriptional regulator, transcriptional repressor for nem operon
VAEHASCKHTNQSVMVPPMAATVRKTTRKPARGDARTALLDAAHKLVRRQGWTATSVDGLCAEAGVSKGAFFHHFASKDELGVAAAQHWTDVTSPLFANAAYQQQRDPLERLLGYLDFRAALSEGSLETFTCFAGTTVQEVFATSQPIRVAAGASITDHAATLTAHFAAAIAQYKPRVAVTAESLAVYTQTVLQGGFVLSKATGDRTPLLDAIDHLKNYLQLLFTSTRKSTP